MKTNLYDVRWVSMSGEGSGVCRCIAADNIPALLDYLVEQRSNVTNIEYIEFNREIEI
jgi:hypothetical protein